MELAGSFFEQDNGFDVQNILGDQQSKFIYEFYITAKAAPKYKYRIMFVAFGISVYPVEVSLEKSIADEIGMDKSEFTLSSEEEVINLVGKVLGSERISAVVSNLINIE